MPGVGAVHRIRSGHSTVADDAPGTLRTHSIRFVAFSSIGLSRPWGGPVQRGGVAQRGRERSPPRPGRPREALE
jgi:hypothetical protein